MVGAEGPLAQWLIAGYGWRAAYLALGIGNVAAQSFQTAGATVVVMLVTLATMWGLEFPLAIVLSRATDLGQLGIAWALVTPMLARPLFFIPYFYSGRWLRVRVFAQEPSVYRREQRQNP